MKQLSVALTAAVAVLAVLLLHVLAFAPASAQPESPAYRLFDMVSPAAAPTMMVRSASFMHTLTSPIYYAGAKRFGASTVAPFTAPIGSLIVFGSAADVWVTPDGGNTWYLVSSPDTVAQGTGPGIPNTLGADMHCGTSNPRNNKLWMIGRSEDIPTTWFSSNGGYTWSTFQSWDSMYLFRGTNNWACTVDNNNTLWAFTNYPWYSTNDGRDMTKMTWGTRYPSERLRHTATSYYSTSFATQMMYIAGGTLRNGAIHLNDVYVTRDYALTWQTLTSSAPWAGRSALSFEAHTSGLLVIAGGRNDYTTYNDVWASVDGGWSWSLIRSQSSYPARSGAALAFDGQGYLWLSGGLMQDLVYDGVPGGATNDIYKSTLSFSTADFTSWARLVNLEFLIPGSASSPCIGLQCWPGEASCRCAQTTPFDFRAMPEAPWWGRFDHKVARLAGGFQRPAKVNGVWTTAAAPADSWVVYGAQQDTWISTNQGMSWTVLAGPTSQQTWIPDGPYPATYATTYTTAGGQVACDHPASNMLYLIGGGSDDQARTTFRSIGGTVWNRTVATGFNGFTGWGICMAESQDTVRYFGTTEGFVTTNGGATWTSLASTAWFPWRSNFVGGSYVSTLFNKRFWYVMGGHYWDTDTGFNDVWVSSDGGVTFFCLTLNAAWPARMDGEVSFTSNGIMALVGGASPRFLRFFNDAFISVDGGYTWFSLDSADSFEPRAGSALMTDALGYLYVWGGNRVVSSWGSDGYKSTYSLNDATTWLPSINRNIVLPPAACVGLSCWPGQTCVCAQPRMTWDMTKQPGGWFTYRNHFFTYLIKQPANYDAINSQTNQHERLNVNVNSFIVFGGDGAAGDVWISTDRTSWRLVAGFPNDTRIPDGYWSTFPDLLGQQGCRSRTSDVFYLLGGASDTTWLSDTWRSEGGVVWTRRSTAGPNTYPPRAYFTCMVDSAGKVLLTGGNVEGSTSYADRSTWVSADQGATFQMVKTRSYYSWRSRHFGDSFYSPIMQRDIFYVMGGYANAQDFNDVWATRDGGITWVMLTANADWPARSSAGSAITDSGVMVVVGGFARRSNIYYGDAWISVDGGFNWFMLRSITQATPRYYPSMLFDEQGYLWMIGGRRLYDDATTRWPMSDNAVYKSTQVFTDTAIRSWLPSVAPGATIANVLGLRCWPGEKCSDVPRNDVPAIPQDTTPTSASSSSSSLSDGAIAGIVIGVLIGVILLAAIAFVALGRAGRGSKSTDVGGGGGAKSGAGGSKWEAQQDVELSVSSAQDESHETH